MNAPGDRDLWFPQRSKYGDTYTMGNREEIAIDRSMSPLRLGGLGVLDLGLLELVCHIGFGGLFLLKLSRSGHGASVDGLVLLRRFARSVGDTLSLFGLETVDFLLRLCNVLRSS